MTPPLPTVLYIGPYYLPEITMSRGLPTRNIAAFNRMKRFAEALSQNGVAVRIASPGITMRCAFYKRIFHKKHEYNEGDIAVTTIPGLGVPFLSIVMEPIFLLTWCFHHILKHRPHCVLVYNFSPSFLILTLAMRIFGVHIIAQIEDVSVPKVSDWKNSSETRPMQQIVYGFCMRAILALSSGAVIPTSRFKQIIPPKKPYLVVTGCMPFMERQKHAAFPPGTKEMINILFAGKYEKEHGVDLLIDFITKVHQKPSLAEKIQFHCCGANNYPDKLKQLSIQCLNSPAIHLHGFLSDGEYQDLLAHAHIVLALQSSRGRHTIFKTPSKAYEFLAFGKIVIATDVGDLKELAPDKLICLKEETADEILYVLIDVLDNYGKYNSLVQGALDYSRLEFSYQNVGLKLKKFIFN